MSRMLRLLIAFALLLANFVCLQGQRPAKSPTYEAYISKYKDLAIQLQKQYKIPASIKLAQGLLETGAGNSRLAREGNNHFGIKCKPEWRGGRMYHTDDAPNECFRTYKSAEESYLDHSLFLSQRPFYVALFDLDIYDYKGWAHGLQRAGYATDRQYGDKLVRLIETYELHRFDRAIATIERRAIRDDIYAIKINTSDVAVRRPELTNWRRRLQKTNELYHIVAQPGDSYESLASDARMKLNRLLKHNEVTADHKLSVGDIVYLEGKKKQASKEHSIHTVKTGESLHKISQIYGLRLKTLYRLNNLRDDYVPKPGDTLRVRK